MPCQEWLGAIEQYCDAVTLYNEAASHLRGTTGPEFNRAWQAVERARLECNKLRASALDHEHLHECRSGISSRVENGRSDGLGR
jgi:hypothetical protein